MQNWSPGGMLRKALAFCDGFFGSVWALCARLSRIPALVLLLFVWGAGVASAQTQTPVIGGATDPSHPTLRQESIFLDIAGAAGAYRLEAMIVRLADAPGRLPIALLTHGKPRNAAGMAKVSGESMVRQSRDLAYRGYLAVAVVRRGYGKSDGAPGVATNAPFAKCNVDDLQKYFAVEADDLEGALRAISLRPDADDARAIVIGVSVGGGVALALGARKPAGLVATVSIAGGVRISPARGTQTCPYDHLTTAFGRIGAASKVPSLWIYAENDQTFAPEVARQLHAAYTQAGGAADMSMIPAIGSDGHNIFNVREGRVYWLAALDSFLRARNLPTWPKARAESVMRTAGVSPDSGDALEKYFSLYTPKVLARAPDGRVSASASTRDLDSARAAALASCQKLANATCGIIMENFSDVAR